MIKTVVETWHRVVAGERPEALDGLLAGRRFLFAGRLHPTARQGRYDDVLRAAAQARPGDPGHGAFHYTKQVLAGDVAMLEFETKRRRQVRQRRRHHPLR